MGRGGGSVEDGQGESVGAANVNVWYFKF